MNAQIKWCYSSYKLVILIDRLDILKTKKDENTR